MILSAFILANSFSLMFIKNADFVDLDGINTVSSISKYYNLMSLVPIKIVTEFLNLDMDISNSIGTTTPVKNTEKKNTTDNTNTDFAFTSYSFTNLVQSYNKFIKCNLVGITEDYSLYFSNFSTIICFLSILYIFIFKGNMILARGDTENNIIINKIEKKFVRLV